MKLISHPSYWRLALLSFFVFLLASSVYAQELTKEQFDAFMKERTTVSQGVIMADIGIYDAKVITQNATSLTIGFDIANNADVAQGDIKYGIDIVKASPNGQTIVDTLVSDETLTLAPHETQSKTLIYTIPPFLSGEYEIWLISRTTGGLMLGLSRVGTTTFTQASLSLELVPDSCHVIVQGETETYTIYQGVDVAPEETLALSCTVMNPSTEPVTVTPAFETHRRTMYGELVTTPVSDESITLKGNEKKTIAFTIPKASTPQAYDVSMQLVGTDSKQPLSNKIVAHYVLRGGSATIQQITLDKDTYTEGETLNARFFWSPSADGFTDSRAGSGTEIGTTTLRMTVTNTDGTLCVEPITQSLSPTQMEYTIQAPVIASCMTPQAFVTLTDTVGNTLDGRIIESPDPKVVTPTNTEIPTKTPFWNMLTIAILLATLSALIVLLVVIQILNRTRSAVQNTNDVSSTILKTLIFTVIVGSSVFGGVEKVRAVTFYPMAGAFIVNANIDKTVYAPGETITVTGSITSFACANGGPVDLGLQAGLNPGNLPGFWYEGVWYPSVPSDPFFAMWTLFDPKTTLIDTSFNGTVTKYGTGYLTAPVTPGTYRVYGLFGDPAYTDLYGSYDPYFLIAAFTVTAPPPVNCVGSWNDNGMCSVSGACGQTGTVQQTFTQTTPASGGGASCTTLYGGEHGATRVGSTACSTAVCPLPCPAGTAKSWSVGANTCNGTTPGVASGINGTVTDSTSPTTGSAAYLCTNGIWAASPNAGATCSVPLPPATPASFTATAGACGTNRIDLTWASSPGATGYDLQIDGGAWVNQGNVLSYAHTGLSASSAHTYAVRAWNAGGAGTGSGVLNRTAPAVCPSADITATPNTIVSGASTLIQWTSNGYTSCSVSGYPWPAGPTGSETHAPLINTLYSLVCDGNLADAVNVTVNTPPVLTATKTVVDPGPTGVAVDLIWNTNNGNEALCTLTGGVLSTNPLDPTNTDIPIANVNTGSTTVTISARTMYTLTCPGGTDTTTIEIVPRGLET